MSLTNQYSISLVRERDGFRAGTWKTLSNWGADSAEVFSREAYNGPRKPLGAPKTLPTLTATKTFYVDLDDSVVNELDAGIGKDIYIVTRQKLKQSGEAVGTTRTRRCLLKSFQLADVNVGADDPDVDTYQVELTPEG